MLWAVDCLTVRLRSHVTDLPCFPSRNPVVILVVITKNAAFTEDLARKHELKEIQYNFLTWKKLIPTGLMCVRVDSDLDHDWITTD